MSERDPNYYESCANCGHNGNYHHTNCSFPSVPGSSSCGCRAYVPPAVIKSAQPVPAVPAVGSHWIHNKTGNGYAVIAVGKLEENGRAGPDFVVYQRADGISPQTWIRPLSSWGELTDSIRPRFSPYTYHVPISRYQELVTRFVHDVAEASSPPVTAALAAVRACYLELQELGRFECPACKVNVDTRKDDIHESGCPIAATLGLKTGPAGDNDD